MSQDSILAQIQVIGRKRERQRLRELARSSGTVWVFLTGRGGVGKTYLLRDLRDWARKESGFLAPGTILDLYHTRLHSRIGFAQGLIQAFEQSGIELKRTREAVDAYFRARARGEKVAEAEAQVGSIVLEELNTWAQKGRLVLFLDTLERMVLPPLLEAGRPLLAPGFWTWLRQEFLPHLKNATIFLGGRPEAQILWKDEKDETPQGITFETVELRGFTLEEVKEYVEEVAKKVAEEAEKAAGPVFEGVPKALQRVNVAHAYNLLKETDEQGQEWGVRPIYLALALDYYLRRSEWPFPLDPKEKWALRQVEKALIEALRREMESALGEDTLLEELAWLRKGVDAHLLAALRESKLSEAEKLLKNLRARKYVFVKVRPEDERVFLHDEVYDMIRRHWLETDALGRKELWNRVDRYYRNRIRELRDEIHQAFSPEEEEFSPKVFQRLSELQNQIQTAQMEHLHYVVTLGSAQDDGLVLYQNLRESASFAQDINLAHLIRAEMAQTLWQEETYGRVEAREHEEEEVRKEWERRLETLREMRDILALEAEAFEVAQAVAREEPQEVIRAAKEIHAPQRIDKDRPHEHAALLFWALSQIRRAFVQMVTGSREQVEQEMEAIRAKIEEHRQTLESSSWRFIRWLLRLVEGFWWHYQGHIAREQGLLYKAWRHYVKALPRWRALNLPFHQAATLNALGLLRSVIGAPSEARAWVQNALRLRRWMGLQGPLALSLNALAVVEFRDEHYQAALALARQAEKIARFLQYERVEGEALHTQAMAQRLQYVPEREPDPERRKEPLEKALEWLNKALQKREPLGKRAWEIRHTRLQILRDLACIPDSEHTWDGFERELRQFLQEAKNREPLWAFAARVTDMWAQVYRWQQQGRPQGEGKEIHKRFQEEEERFQRDPDIKPLLFAPDHIPVFHSHQSRPFLLEHLARFYAAWGVLLRELAMVDLENKAQYLQEAAIRWTLSMEYNAAIPLEAGEFWGYRRATGLIYSYIQDLNVQEALALYKGCQQAWEQYLPQDHSRYLAPNNLAFWRFLEGRIGPEKELERSQW